MILVKINFVFSRLSILHSALLSTSDRAFWNNTEKEENTFRFLKNKLPNYHQMII